MGVCWDNIKNALKVSELKNYPFPNVSQSCNAARLTAYNHVITWTICQYSSVSRVNDLWYTAATSQFFLAMNICFIVQSCFVSAFTFSVPLFTPIFDPPLLKCTDFWAFSAATEYLYFCTFDHVRKNAVIAVISGSSIWQKGGWDGFCVQLIQVVMLISARCNGSRPLTLPVIYNDMCFWKKKMALPT